VLDRGKIAGGVTSRTTAHLAPVCDDGVASLIKLRGKDLARQFQVSQSSAVDRIEELVGTHDISCNFRRLDAFLFPTSRMSASEAREQQDEEFKALRAVGADVEKSKGTPFENFRDVPVLHYSRQATFHPLRYLKAVVELLLDQGARIYSDSPVKEIQESDGGVRVSIANGHAVSAQQAVVATNSPINNLVALHSKLAPYRTYAMAFTLPSGTLPDALYWDMDDPYHYVRLNPGPGSVDYLIVGGEDHKSGEVDDGWVRFEALESWIRPMIPKLGKEVHRWSGQVLDSFDYCGFVGLNPGNKRTYIVTGDSGQGMTHGVLAGLILRDLIVSGSNQWAEVYEPTRKTPSGVGNYVRENITAVKNAAEYLTPGEISSVDDLKAGEGGILREGLSKIAVCRIEDGSIHRRSAVCTHLGCIIHWNSTEQCWDCPCHGSHFAPDGAVLNGPAIAPLKSA
jgi:glycine/D-amino acid oxidase-like deaminating enzyme/nitrite reductase/ring-hydroxylating ferredoxin subunit